MGNIEIDKKNKISIIAISSMTAIHPEVSSRQYQVCHFVLR